MVQTRFYVPPTMLFTCGDDVLRFEAFSACCEAYARVDFLPPALDGERAGCGTIHVDFNARRVPNWHGYATPTTSA